MRRTLALAALIVSALVSLVVGLSIVPGTAADRELITAQREMAAVGFVVARAPDPAAVAEAFRPGGGLAESAVGRRIVVIMPDGTRLGHASAVRSAPPVSAPDLERARSQTAAVETTSDGTTVILQPVPAARGGTAVILHWTPGDRFPAWLWPVLAALLAMAVAALAGHRLGAHGARLVRRFGRAAAAVRNGEVVVRIEPAGPKELRDAASAFNAMSERVAGRLAAEKRAAGDLPHRLRTPLAALRLRVDRLAPGPREDAARTALDRLENEVDLLIRAGHVPDGGPQAGCDAAEVVAERAAYWSALAEDQGRVARVSGPDRPVPVLLGRERLATALDALIGNVFHHTPEGTAYAVALEPGADRATIVVTDAGPGIADPETALRRGRSGGGSTGLGLDIARRVAESGGGGLRIDRSPVGARIVFWARTDDVPAGAA